MKSKEKELGLAQANVKTYYPTMAVKHNSMDRKTDMESRGTK